MNVPILEFDDSGRPALIEPAKVIKRADDMPECVVLCFFADVISAVCSERVPGVRLGSEIGPNPLYVIESEGQRIGVLHPGVGAPLAGAFLEELIAFGGRKFIACGGAGVLDSTLEVGSIIVPVSAVRDEGFSYHYLPPAREVAPHPDAVRAILDVLNKHRIPHQTGKTWTTDAIYRETPNRIMRRRDEGCITVEMEAAAFFAVAQFRGVTFGQLLYGGDDVGGDVWDNRNWIHGRAGTREKLFWLSVEACLRL
jgi:nucleoside phosphorylase